LKIKIMKVLNPFCLKCNRSNWEIDDLESECRSCGLRVEIIPTENKVVVYGNLDFAWYTGQIKLPASLEVYGDFDLTGCKGVEISSSETLIMHGNMYICNSNTENFSKNFKVGGFLFLKNTPALIKRLMNNTKCWKESFKEDGEKILYKFNQNVIDEWMGFEKITEKLPEFEGLI